MTNKVADEIIRYYKILGSVRILTKQCKKEIFRIRWRNFTEKMIPAILDDFKSKEWMPAIHTGDFKTKISKICEMIYFEK